MNKYNTLFSVLALSAISLAPALTNANPIGVYADIYCPSTQGSTNVITNFGDYIAGYGTESMLSQNNQIYFQSSTLPSEMPTKLTNYYNEMADYNSATGKVSCSYTSSMPTEPRFVVYYTLTNGKGGAIQWQNASTVSLLLPFGRHA